MKYLWRKGIALFTACILLSCLLPQASAVYESVEGITAYRGERIVLNPYALDGDNLNWSTDDPSIAIVDQMGRVTGVSLGTTTITATDGTNIMHFMVTVERGMLETKMKWQQLRPNTVSKIYSEDFSLHSPYAAGALSEEYIQSGTNLINYLRYLVGLPDVSSSSNYNTDAQYGALLLAASGTLEHTPPRPSNMDLKFYNRGFYATSTSNIGWASGAPATGYTLSYFTLGYMEEPGVNNAGILGHRRWILNPKLGRIGFGLVSRPDNQVYSALKVFDTSGDASAAPAEIAWPSGWFPVEYTYDDYVWSYGSIVENLQWSISLDTSKYQQLTAKTMRDLTVTLTDITDPDAATKKQWVFYGDDPFTAGFNTGAPDDGSSYLRVSTQSYGVPNCIMFRAKDAVYEPGSVFHVQIDGLRLADGTPTSYSYETRFFNHEPNPVHAVRLNQTNGSLSVGKTEKLTASVEGLYGAFADYDVVEWASSDPRVLTVDQLGNVTAVSEGIATISASAGGMFDQCTYIVIAAQPVLPGDINGDGQIRLNDLTLAVQIYTDKLQADSQMLSAADYNGDGNITLQDIMHILIAYQQARS